MLVPLVGALAIGAGLFDGVPPEWHDGWTVEVRSGPRPFGLDAEQIFDADERRLFVHPTADGTWSDLRRSAIAALFFALDSEHGWSDDGRWRVHNAWRGFFATALAPMPHASNRAGAGYVDDVGRRSPRWDLATHAAAFFAPRDGERCRHLSVARFFADTLALDDYQPARRCPAFARWAQPDAVAGIEVALASPTTATIGSMFGHLFFRVVPKGERGMHGLAASRTFSYVAETHFASRDDPLYVFKGIFGGYRAKMVEASFLDTYRLYVVDEDRDIVRFRLRLSEEERLRLFERIHSVLQTFRPDYYFFGQNCASLLIELVNGVLPAERRVHHPGALGKGPTTALDGLAFARAYDGGPLLVRVGDTFASFDRDARDADARRRIAEAELVDLLGTRVEATFERMHATSPLLRAEAYRALVDHLGNVEHPAVAVLIDASVRVEVALSARDNREREAEATRARRRGQHALLARLVRGLPGLAARHVDGALLERLARATEAVTSRSEDDRIRGYAALADVVDALRSRDAPNALLDAVRLLGFVASVIFDDRTLRLDPDVHRRLLVATRAPKLRDQPYVEAHRSLFVRERVLEVSDALLAAQVARQRLRRTGVASAPGDDRYTRAFPHAGVDMFGVGVSDRGLRLAGAVFDERLGDHRRHGFSSRSAFRFIAGDATWYLDGLRPRVARSRFELVRYRKLPSRPLVGADVTDEIGFEFSAGTRTRDLGAGSQWSILAGGGGVAPLFSRDDLAVHVLLTVGADVEYQFARASLPSRWLWTVPVGVEARVPLLPEHRLAHDLFARVAAGPSYDVLGRRWHRRTRAALGVSLALFEALALPGARTVGISWVAEVRYDASTTILGAAVAEPLLVAHTGVRID
ncbi:MAG: DUF4105 domain-containing protein [Deltaproteobacteria bacterium]|jgi:hypothetical protein